MATQNTASSGSLTKGIIFVILTAICFSMQEISGSALTSDLNAWQVNAISYTIGAFILLPLAIHVIRKNDINLHYKDWLYFLLLGAIQVAIGMTLLQESLYYVSPDIAAVLVCSNAIMTVPLARVINKESFNPKAWISIILAAIGIIIIFNPLGVGGIKHESASLHIIGVSLGLLGAICLAMFNVLATRTIKKYGKEVTNSISFILGCGLMYIFMIIFGIPIFKHIIPIIPHTTAILKTIGVGSALTAKASAMFQAFNHGVWRNLAILVFIGITVKGLGFFFFLGAMHEIGAINTTSVFYIKPILVPIFAYIILGTVIAYSTLLGTVFIVAAALFLYYIRKTTGKKKTA